MNDSFSSSNHINFRSAQYENLKSVLGMTTVEINPTELCNRTCSFCPRGNGYPNKDEHLTIDDAYLIKNRLDEFEYQGIIIISGKGEPLLNPDILEIVNVFKNEWIELISNGDKILEFPSMLDELFDNGLSRIILDEYDNEENYNKKIEILGDRCGVIKNHFAGGLQSSIFNNRSGSFKTIEKSLDRKCYLPFYKGYIDLTMDLRFCCNDWKYKESLGNLRENTLEELWMSDKMNKYRKELSKGNRCNVISCKECDANGLLLGKDSYNKLMEMI
jgi:MoaA/NifB/PqqE/SkfB family radical SAM enzyme